MNILHIIASANPKDGGPIEGVRCLHRAFAECGHHSHMLTLDHPEAPFIQNAEMPIYPLGRQYDKPKSAIGRFRKWARYSPDAKKWLCDNVRRFDAVIVEGLWNYADEIAAQILPNSGVPYGVFPHGMLDPWFTKESRLKHAAKAMLWRHNRHRLLAQAQAVFFTCAEEERLAQQTWTPWEINAAVVGYGTILPALGDTQTPSDTPPYLLFLGRIHPKKGITVLLEGFAQSALHHNLRLIIAGEGDPDYVASLKNFASQLGISARVSWPGGLWGQDKWAMLKGATAFILTSYQENFGVAVAEALGTAKPVIISNHVNIWQDVARAEAGLVCDASAQSTKDVIVAFSQFTQAQRRAMGDNGKTLFTERFEMQQVARRICEIFWPKITK